MSHRSLFGGRRGSCQFASFHPQTSPVFVCNFNLIVWFRRTTGFSTRRSCCCTRCAARRTLSARSATCRSKRKCHSKVRIPVARGGLKSDVFFDAFLSGFVHSWCADMPIDAHYATRSQPFTPLFCTHASTWLVASLKSHACCRASCGLRVQRSRKRPCTVPTKRTVRSLFLPPPPLSLRFTAARSA